MRRYGYSGYAGKCLYLDLFHGTIKTTILPEELTLTLPKSAERHQRDVLFSETISETECPMLARMIAMSLSLPLQ